MPIVLVEIIDLAPPLVFSARIGDAVHLNLIRESTTGTLGVAIK